MEELAIAGAWVHTPRIHSDDRGSVLEWFNGGTFTGDVGHPLTVAQANCPVTRRGGIRGVHYADVPPGQAKYITCVAGAILDVVVDLRTGSPTFGQWAGVRLDDVERKAVYVAEGLGHAFMALSDQASVVYLCSTPYTPEREHGINPLDPALAIAWPAGIEPVLSAKDASAPSLAEAARSGTLPSYERCVAYRSGLQLGAV